MSTESTSTTSTTTTMTKTSTTGNKGLGEIFDADFDWRDTPPIIQLERGTFGELIEKQVTLEVNVQELPQVIVTSSKIDHLILSLTALAEKAKLSKKELIACKPDDLAKRLGKVYTTTAVDEADKNLLEEATTLSTSIGVIVKTFDEQLLKKIQELKDLMSQVFNLTNSQANILLEWKQGALKKPYSTLEIETISSWIKHFLPEDEEFVKQWLQTSVDIEYTVEEQEIIQNILKIKGQVKVDYGEFAPELIEFHAKFQSDSIEASNIRKELDELKESLETRISKDKSYLLFLPYQEKGVNCFSASVHMDRAIVSAQNNEFNSRTRQISTLLETMEKQLSNMEVNIMWWFKFYFSFCCYCSCYSMDPNETGMVYSTYTQFMSSYVRNKYKWAEEEELVFNNKRIVEID